MLERCLVLLTAVALCACEAKVAIQPGPTRPLTTSAPRVTASAQVVRTGGETFDGPVAPLPNAGSLVITVRGPADAVLAREGAALVSNNGSSLVSDAGGGILGKMKLGLLALADLTAPVAGAKAALVDAAGQVLAQADAPTAADGTATFSHPPSSSALVFVRAGYVRNGVTVELVALVEAPRTPGAHAAQLDPATTLVAKQLAAQAGTRPALLDTLDPTAVARAVDAAAQAMDAQTVAAASLLNDQAAAATYEDLKARVPAVAQAAPPSPTPAPTATPVGATPTPAAATPTPAATATPKPSTGPVTQTVAGLIAQGDAAAAGGNGAAANAFYRQAADAAVTFQDAVSVGVAANAALQVDARQYAETVALGKAATDVQALQVAVDAASVGDATNADAAFKKAADVSATYTNAVAVAVAAKKAGRLASQTYAYNQAAAKAATYTEASTVAQAAYADGDAAGTSTALKRAADLTATADEALAVANTANATHDTAARNYALDAALGKAKDPTTSVRVGQADALVLEGTRADAAFRQAADQCTTKAAALSVAANATAAGQAGAASYANTKASGLP